MTLRLIERKNLTAYARCSDGKKGGITHHRDAPMGSIQKALCSYTSKRSKLVIMTQNIDDVHCYDTGFLRAMDRLQRSDILGKDIIADFITYCRVSGLAKSTVTNHLNHLTRMASDLKKSE